MSSILRQTIVTLVPEEYKGSKEMRDGILTLTPQNLSFVQQHNKTAQAIPYFIVIGLGLAFFWRVANGTLALQDTFLLTFSWAAAIGMLIYSVYRLYQITSTPKLVFQLDIPLVSIDQLAEEQLRFSRRRRILQVKTYQGKVHRFATITAVADWVQSIGEGLQSSYGRSLQFRQDGDIPTWRVKGS